MFSSTKEFDEQLSVRCTSRMKSILETKAMQKGITLSEYIRSILQDEITNSEVEIRRD